MVKRYLLFYHRSWNTGEIVEAIGGDSIVQLVGRQMELRNAVELGRRLSMRRHNYVGFSLVDIPDSRWGESTTVRPLELNIRAITD